MPDVADKWSKKPWNVTEEMWKRKARGMEDQYQRLLTEHQELRLEKAKMSGELRVLQRYKDTAEDTISKETANRKYEHKEKIAAMTKLEQALKRYERECDRVSTLERENAFLSDQISNMKGDNEKRLDILKELEDAQKRAARQKETIRELEVVSIERENAILELKEKQQKLKRKVAYVEEALSDKTDECKSLEIRLEAVESAWESARGQNRSALSELKKHEGMSKEYESLKSETKNASYRIHALDLEIETTQSKLRQKDRTIDELRDSNARLRREVTKCTEKIEDLTSSVTQLQDEVIEREKDIERKDESLRMKKAELKTLNKTDSTSRDRVHTLERKISNLQQQLLDTQKEYVNRSKKDEYSREKQRAKDRAEIMREMETLHKPRRCKNCNETFTNKSNSSLACSYHPGRFVARHYPLEGYQWSCCQKRDLASRPCKFAGRHMESKSLDY